MKVPIEWRRVPIREVYIGLFDGPHATPPKADSGPVFLGIGNITEDGHLDFGSLRHIAEEDFAKWTKRVVPQEGDIVFTYEATLNRYALIPKGFRGCLGRRLALIRPNPKEVDKRFLHYYFFSADWRATIEANKLAGATVDRIPLTKFPEFPISLPPLPTQRRIASILSAYDDLIENNTRRIEILEEMARRLYEEWFVHFRFPGHEKVKFKESELGRIPEGWEVLPLGQVLQHHIGGGWGKDESSEDFPICAYVVRGTDIPSVRKGSLGNAPLRFHKESNYRTRKLQAKDIVFEVSGGSKDQPVGRSVLLPQKVLMMSEQPIICASFCRLVRANRDVLVPEILQLHFERIYANREIMKYQTQSTGITNFKFSVFLEKERLVIPPSTLQEAFLDHVQRLYELSASLGVKNVNLAAQRDLLLPKLFSGEIDVSGILVADDKGLAVA